MQLDIFGIVDAVNKKKPRSTSWVMTDHVCKKCFGRILMRKINSTHSEVICSECEEYSKGTEVALCWCGKKVDAMGVGFECIKNPHKNPLSPNSIMVREKKQENKKREDRPNRYVKCPGDY